MSKRALAILAAVEGLIILGLAGLLVGVGRTGSLAWGAGRMATGMFRHHGFGMGMAGIGLWPMLAAWVLGLLPIVLVAVIVALILRRSPPSEPPA